MAEFDPELDLVLERVVDVRRELLWKAWTVPEHLKCLCYEGDAEDATRLYAETFPDSPVF